MFAYFIYIIAGMGAGIGTGLAGLSAAAVISPMLITFLGFDPYEAVGISLASDVLASAISAYTYGKNKNLDIKNGLVMLASVLVFTLIGSYIASLVPGGTMGSFSVFMTLLGSTSGEDTKREKYSIINMWLFHWIYLWVYWCWWRNDVIVDINICSSI